jgi:hypothetical protein
MAFPKGSSCDWSESVWSESWQAQFLLLSGKQLALSMSRALETSESHTQQRKLFQLGWSGRPEHHGDKEAFLAERKKITSKDTDLGTWKAFEQNWTSHFGCGIMSAMRSSKKLDIDLSPVRRLSLSDMADWMKTQKVINFLISRAWNCYFIWQNVTLQVWWDYQVYADGS